MGAYWYVHWQGQQWVSLRLPPELSKASTGLTIVGAAVQVAHPQQKYRELHRRVAEVDLVMKVSMEKGLLQALRAVIETA